MTDRPGYDAEHVVRGLALPRSVGHLVAGLGGLAVATTVGLLWATEPGELAPRTRIAFTGVIGVGMAWAGFAGWALARRPLFAVDRVIAAWLAVTFSALMTVGMVTVALARASAVGILAGGGLGVALTVLAGVLLARARAYRRALLHRRHELERQGRFEIPPCRPRQTENNAYSEGKPTTMTSRKPLPIGPLALVLRYLRPASASRHIVVLAVVLAAALLAGIVLMLR